jgi:hypothetical protein
MHTADAALSCPNQHKTHQIIPGMNHVLSHVFTSMLYLVKHRLATATAMLALRRRFLVWLPDGKWVPLGLPIFH